MAAPLNGCLCNCGRTFQRFSRSAAIHFQKRPFRFCAVLKSEVSNINDEIQLATSSKVQVTKEERISKAMRIYLENAKKYNDMINVQIAEYEIGKRHLANIMGVDPDDFSQQDVDKAIEYLLPSGLFDKQARPALKHPEEVFPVRKAAQLGLDGRPLHFLFYTFQPNYYELMYNIVQKLEKLKKEEINMVNRGYSIKPNTLKLMGSNWLRDIDLENKILEKVNEHDYRRFVQLMDRFVSHPLAYMEEEFIQEYRITQKSLLSSIEILPVVKDENGREYIESVGTRKRTTAYVKLYLQGTGKVNIDGDDILQFKGSIPREQLMFPLQLCGKLGEVDIEARTESRGVPKIYSQIKEPPEIFMSVKAGAVRFALSRALCSIVNQETLEKMRLAGLLTRDPRRRERKKPGQEGARRKFTWKKR